MNKATINISFKGKTFTSEFPITQTTKEYEIADEAYRLGLLFAHTQLLAKYGYELSPHEFGKMLQDLDYSYSASTDNSATTAERMD